MSATLTSTGTGIRPFHIDIPVDAVDDLRAGSRRGVRPSRSRSRIVAGVQLTTLQSLAEYYSTEDYLGEMLCEVERAAAI